MALQPPALFFCFLFHTIWAKLKKRVRFYSCPWHCKFPILLTLKRNRTMTTNTNQIILYKLSIVILNNKSKDITLCQSCIEMLSLTTNTGRIRLLPCGQAATVIEVLKKALPHYVINKEKNSITTSSTSIHNTSKHANAHIRIDNHK